jgi:GntR family transcriptional repressor for pyruvate dehydrogenase complex
LAAGDKLPTEAEFMAEFGVSRTVVREAISKLQASGLVLTRHGIGTFVVGLGDAAPFRLAPEQFATLRDVIAVLELRIGIETEAASLAAQRRNADNLRQMRSALDAVAAAVEQGRDAVGPDFQFHLEVARATQNAHFADLMSSLGTMIIPRARRERYQRRAAPVPEARQRRAREHLRRYPQPGQRRRARGDAHAPGQQPRAPTARRRAGFRVGLSPACHDRPMQLSCCTTTDNGRLS